MRRGASVVLLVVAGLLFPLAVVANWAKSTVYDSETFSERAVDPLDSQVVRRELARKLTEQLVVAGNQQAVNFRPAFELAIESVIDTDTFRSIFRTAVRQTHEAILADRGAEAGLNLGDSFALIASSLQAQGGAGQEGGLDNSLSDVTETVGDLGIWNLEETIDTLALVFLFGALAAAAGSIFLANDRRRAVRRLGWTAVVDGVAIVVLLLVLTWIVGQQISDAQLSEAIGAALGEVTDDLRLTGLWIAAYGVVIAAAATTGTRYTPAEVWRRVRGWVDRRRSTTMGTLVLGGLGLLISIVCIQEPLGNLELVVRAAALWVGYLAVVEILRLVRTVTARATERRARWPRFAVIGGTLVVIVALVTTGFVLTTRGAATAAEESGKQECNGKKSLCDLRIDQVTFPGAHNAMSSSLYPGYLFAEQIGTIPEQLDAGVRALLIDTHYGVPSTARVPGVDTPLILTDKAAEAGVAAAEAEDPAETKRAARLAARAPRAADAQRGIYLCHNNCELGAVDFGKAMTDIKAFLDTHPDDVVMTIIQDATDPAETARAIEAAGLSDRVATLELGQPLPTLRKLIESRRTLIVFAERGAPGGPPWYHPAYEWFQETGYTFAAADRFNCNPNRGPATAPLFLINHWVTSSPPNPATGEAANASDVLDRRIQNCIAERGLAPNIIAVDFSERGRLISTAGSINEARLKEERARRKAAEQPPAPPPTATITTTPPAEPLPPPADSTVIDKLTGGDPARACAASEAALRAIAAWAVAVLGDAPSDAGVTDFVYAPLLRRDVKAYVDAAPKELGQRAQPILTRARDAVKTLRGLGLSGDDISRLADAAGQAVGSEASPDGVTVRAQLLEQLQEKVPADRLSQAAVVFSAGQSDPAGLLDLGFVPPEVGAAAGFDCNVQATI